MASFEFSQNDQLAEAKCLIDGKRQVTAAAITESVATVRLTFEFADFNTLGFAYDELPTNSLNVPLPILKSAQVPTAAPFEVTDTDITATNLGSVLVYRASDKTFLKPVTTGPLAPDEFTASVGKITFGAASGGATVQYQVLKTYASMPTIGVANTADNFGTLEFNGVLFQAEGERYSIQFPKLSRVSTPQISINGNLAEISVEFRASVRPGDRKPYKLFNLSKAIAV